MKIIITLMFAMSSLFIFLNHPISMGLTLIVQTILLAMLTGLMNMNFWFSYILFLVMIGGLLILFIYMTSVASNEKFKFSIFNIVPIIIWMPIMFFINSSTNKFKVLETLNMKDNNSIFYLFKYFNFPSMMMALFAMIYLLLTLIVVVKLTKKNLGPIRQNS
uniref:NADH-ubiquinone oxidoreductase chain 6 n=1 Tax=Chrysomeloidea sp. 1 KM-2017 TaxID=2219295 RepID=A0A346RJN9_9CUCU|nr:NADH dehydrogenase subunit 6 [Chrysomeloidea sp. 1 KM-2017]